MPLDNDLNGVTAYQPTFADPDWTNPGRTQSERDFFERKKAEHDLKHGGPPALRAPVTQGAYLPHIHQPEQNKDMKRGARMSGRKRQAPIFGDAPKAFVSKGMRRKIMHAAEAFERDTKMKGRKNGLLGATGVNVLRVLLFTFMSAKGQTYPSYKALMEATGYCKQTIAECIDRLERHGFLKVINRIKRVTDQVFSALHSRMIEMIRVVQTSNAYTIHLPDDLAAPQVEPVAHRPFPPRRLVERSTPVMGWNAIRAIMQPDLGFNTESGT